MQKSHQTTEVINELLRFANFKSFSKINKKGFNGFIHICHDRLHIVHSIRIIIITMYYTFVM